VFSARLFSLCIAAAVSSACQAPDECEIGQKECQENVLMFCNGEVIDNQATGRFVFIELDDCSANTDSGFTVCGELDGEPACIQP
jgi:hypothetical protein